MPMASTVKPSIEIAMRLARRYVALSMRCGGGGSVGSSHDDIPGRITISDR
jgi:hypothetical protein